MCQRALLKLGDNGSHTDRLRSLQCRPVLGHPNPNKIFINISKIRSLIILLYILTTTWYRQQVAYYDRVNRAIGRTQLRRTASYLQGTYSPIQGRRVPQRITHVSYYRGPIAYSPIIQGRRVHGTHRESPILQEGLALSYRDRPFRTSYHRESPMLQGDLQPYHIGTQSTTTENPMLRIIYRGPIALSYRDLLYIWEPAGHIKQNQQVLRQERIHSI